MTTDQAIERIQFCYPQIYYACHTRHERRRSDAARLSQRDIEILVHLDRRVPMSLTELARHMDLAASTLSEAISALERHGYVVKARQSDRRLIGLVLTDQGIRAVRSESVLESSRLKTVLARLSGREQAKVVSGLATLARACRKGASP